jgi:putative membrane protein
MSTFGMLTNFSGMNAYLATGLSYLIGILVVGIGLLFFSLLTRYNDLGEIQRGNVAVGLATGGLILSLSNIMRFAILANSTILGIISWGGIGILGLIFSWLLFEKLTPQFCVDDELGNDNRSVGIMVFSVFMAISFIVGASIS